MTIFGAVALWGCSQRPDFVAKDPKDEPWRDAEERSCLTSGLVRESGFVTQRSALGGPSVCGALKPFHMTAAADGRVALKPTATLRCPMIPAIDRWVREAIEPAARQHLGRHVVELRVAASYACRAINHVSGGRLSEHGHANAFDVSAFVLADGRAVTVKAGWYGDPRERAFLRAVHQGACARFTTVLGPNADANHRDHFHVDLAWHGRDGRTRICK